MISIIGITATGKTSLAAHIAYQTDGEIISADSRQVYRGMDIGTGKDIKDYFVQDVAIPFHLVDIVDAGYEYSVFEYQKDFHKVYRDVIARRKNPILCGGSGMYIEAVLKGYKLIQVPVNDELRKYLEGKTDDELIAILKSFKTLHNKTDIDNRKRLIRAIEIETYYEKYPEHDDFPKIDYQLFGIHFERDVVRNRITKRLKDRISDGMVDEVKQLLDMGVAPDKLKYYGLEYKFITQYILGELSFNDMFQKLNSAIHQFSKRQMTWFRKMEREGFEIHWIDGDLPLESKVDFVLDVCKR